MTSLFKMGTSLNGKNLLPEGANSSLTTLSVPIFITHVRILRNGSYANGPEITQKWEKRIKWGKAKIRNRYNQVPHLAQGTA